MARRPGEWLADLAAGGRQREPGDHAGKRLGLPEDGPGAVAPTGTRVMAFLVDVAASSLIGRLLQPIEVETADASASYAPFAVFVVATVLGLALVGQSPGMRLLGLRAMPLSGDPARVGIGRAVLRTVLLSLLVPAVITDRDGRGLHDRAARTVVVRARR